MREINEIIVHCAATRPEWMADRGVMQKVGEIRKWHKGRGWKDIGYHYVIDRDGDMAKGRPVEQNGAHVKGRNAKSIGICLIGGHGSSENDAFSEHFTPEQDAALRKLIGDLKRQFWTIDTVSGHNQYAAKACPGFHVPAWLDGGATRRAQPTPPKEVADLIQEAEGSGSHSKSVLLTAAQVVAGGGAAGLAWLGDLDKDALIVGMVCVSALVAFYIHNSRARKDRKAKAARDAVEALRW